MERVLVSDYIFGLKKVSRVKLTYFFFLREEEKRRYWKGKKERKEVQGSGMIKGC